MRNTLKRLTALALALVLLLALTSCGKKDSDSDEDTKAAVSSEKDAEEDEKETTKKTKEKTTEKTTEEESTTKATTTTTTTAASSSTSLFSPSETYKANYKYCIAVNITQNITIIYGKDANGNYTNPVKAICCSCGKSSSPTITGTYYTQEHSRWLSLYGGVYGQYTTRITGAYLFHSVPYYQQDPSTLEVDEYNKLGQGASLGCVRMCVEDAYWIYSNIPTGTMVKLYASTAAEPMSAPAPTRITVSSSDPRYGWDPTDPDANNPW